MDSNSKIARILGFGIYEDEQVEGNIKIKIQDEIDKQSSEQYKKGGSELLDKILADIRENIKIAVFPEGETPFILYEEDTTRFVISFSYNGNTYIASSLIKLFQEAFNKSSSCRDKEKKENILKGIIEYYLSSKDNIRQAESLAEEVYLIYRKSKDSLEQGVLSLFRNTSERILKKANEGKSERRDKAMDILEDITNRIKCAKYRCDKKRILKYLLECDLKYNEEQRSREKCLPGQNLQGIETKGKSIRYKDIVFTHQEGYLYVIGDTHGDHWTTKYIISNIEESLTKDDFVVFLGDYVNNGLNSIDNLITVLEFKREYPDNVILLSGNHEFRESYLTVSKEFFETHWNNSFFKPFPFNLPPRHYGHIRLELIIMFGVEEGEEIYELFERWGRSLPYIAFSKKGIIVSHSTGWHPDIAGNPLEMLARAKEDRKDIEQFDKFGYEAWKKLKGTIHCNMVNAKEENDIKNSLEEFSNLGINEKLVFLVGNTHYRSGDINDKEMTIVEEGILVTICSSCKESPESGHYMYQEMVVESFNKKFNGEKGNRFNEGREGEAVPCYVKFGSGSVGKITQCNLVLVQ